MRANRSSLRKNLSEPLQKKRTEKLHNDLQKELKEKSGTMLGKLKNILSKKSKPKNKEVEDSMDTDLVPIELEAVGENKVKTSSTTVFTKSKGRKPRPNNENKTLVWF